MPRTDLASVYRNLEALDGINLKLADVYLRDLIRQHKLFVLSTQAADEMNIAYLADYARHFDLPVELNSSVRAVRRADGAAALRAVGDRVRGPAHARRAAARRAWPAGRAR